MRILKILLLHTVALVIGIVIFALSHTAHRAAGAHLTAASIHVSGYNRNGYYISDYDRRPPGSVAHDAPFESSRSLYMATMVLGICIAVFPVFTLKRSLKECLSDIRESTLTIAQPYDGNSRIKLVTIHANGSSVIRLQDFDELLSAVPGQFYVSTHIDKGTLRLLSASSKSGHARFEHTCRSDALR
jgi:hypothetical protein